MGTGLYNTRYTVVCPDVRIASRASESQWRSLILYSGYNHNWKCPHNRDSRQSKPGGWATAAEGVDDCHGLYQSEEQVTLHPWSPEIHAHLWTSQKALSIQLVIYLLAISARLSAPRSEPVSPQAKPATLKERSVCPSRSVAVPKSSKRPTLGS